MTQVHIVSEQATSLAMEQEIDQVPGAGLSIVTSKDLPMIAPTRCPSIVYDAVRKSPGIG